MTQPLSYLSARERACVVLSQRDHLNYEQIADLLAIGVQEVRDAFKSGITKMVEEKHKAALPDGAAKVTAETRFEEDLARLDQIRRALLSAQPTTQNPAWMNCHHDCVFLLSFIDKLWKEYGLMTDKAERLSWLAMNRGERR